MFSRAPLPTGAPARLLLLYHQHAQSVCVDARGPGGFVSPAILFATLV